MRRGIGVAFNPVARLTDEVRMRLCRMTGVRPLCERLRGIARAQDGSFLIEAMVSAMIIVIVGLGVLKTLDRGNELGGQQKVQAVAGNIAQTEIDSIRALPISAQSNLHRDSTRTVGAVHYSISSRAQWVNDASGDASCTTADSSADYMKLSTVVSWPQMSGRKPVTLESLSTPGVRAFDANQGSLAVKISDRNGDGLSALQLGLSGGATLSDATNDDGCVLWGYLPEGSDYALSFSRPPDYVLANGSQAANVPVAVVGGETSNVELQYDRGGHIQTKFVTKRTDIGALIATDPKFAHVTHSGGGGVSSSFAVTSAGGTSGLLFPFTSAYTIHADSCSAAEVPVPAPVPDPESPAAPSAVAATVTPGATTTSADVQLPALNIKVRSGGVFKSGAIVRVTTPCGTVYRRTTTSSGAIDDPGFPYATSLDICVSDGTRQRSLTRANTNFNVTTVTMSILSSDPLGTCA
ncbi:MAG: hypothetical protein QOE31_525 [Solirubrobacteraceae bacterium]|nr:hypothetical protein [Solirubrobacteraceae bacterium]